MSHHVLVVDDNIHVRETLEFFLKVRGNYRVMLAPDGETALTLLDEHVFDVVLTDMNMKQVDGLHVVQAATRKDNPPIVIVLTGNRSQDVAEAVSAAGGFQCLYKPCPSEHVLACIHEALESRVQSCF